MGQPDESYVGARLKCDAGLESHRQGSPVLPEAASLLTVQQGTGHTPGACARLEPRMERKSGVLDTVVIGQDDQTELHVQAAIVGGRRQVDIRIWKRGPTGFAPSRSALTV